MYCPEGSSSIKKYFGTHTHTHTHTHTMALIGARLDGFIISQAKMICSL